MSPSPHVPQSAMMSAKQTESHIPPLEGHANFALWKTYISERLSALGWWPHVSGSDNAHHLPSYPPAPCTMTSSYAQVLAFRNWWATDGKVRVFILGHLSMGVYKKLDSTAGTARTIWRKLEAAYARPDACARFALKEKLLRAKLRDHTDVKRYLKEFSEAVNDLAAMGAPCADEDIAYLLFRGLPVHGHWKTFRKDTMEVIQGLAHTGLSTLPDVPGGYKLFSWLVKRISKECKKLQTESRTVEMFESAQAAMRPYVLGTVVPAPFYETPFQSTCIPTVLPAGFLADEKFN